MNKFKEKAINALTKKYEAQMDMALANLGAYLENDPVGIGEHPDIVEAVETKLEEISKAHDMLEALEIAKKEYE